MLDKRKVELMTQLAFYEQTEGKETLRSVSFTARIIQVST